MCLEVKMHGECLYKKGAEFMVFLARGVQDNIPSFATPIALALIKEELGLPVIFFYFFVLHLPEDPFLATDFEVIL